jgi:hypothetical protein
MRGWVGAPFPTGVGLPRRPRLASRTFHQFATTPHPVELARLASLPNPVDAVTAVPDALARPFSTKPLRRVPLNRLWSRCAPRTVSTDPRVEINSAAHLPMIGRIGT